MKSRPQSEEELQKREAIGVIRASRFVREYAKSHKLISVETISIIHKEIFKDAWPEIAGVFRRENLTISGSDHVPPHFSEVSLLMEKVGERIGEYTQELEHAEGYVLNFNDMSKKRFEIIGNILNFAAYLHHIITYIHPFREGNGRTARLAGNLILERYGLVGISIKVEKENKNRYCNALSQIDRYEDYEPLLDLISEGIIDRYNGVAFKILK